MNSLTPFERGLIDHVRAFCRGYDSHGDQQTQFAMWLIMSSLKSWEERGAEAALARINVAFNGPEKRGMKETRVKPS